MKVKRFEVIIEANGEYLASTPKINSAIKIFNQNKRHCKLWVYWKKTSMSEFVHSVLVYSYMTQSMFNKAFVENK